MTPERIQMASDFLTLIGFLSLVRQVYWQIVVQRRRYPKLRWYWALRQADRQTVSAFLFLSMTTLVVAQLMLAYLRLVPFGTSPRGPVFYFGWCLALIWWNICTERHNGRRRSPLGSVAE